MKRNPKSFYPSQTFLTRAFNCSPWKKMMKTDLNTLSPEAGSSSQSSISAWRKNTFPRQIRHNIRSKSGRRSRKMTPETNLYIQKRLMKKKVCCPKKEKKSNWLVPVSNKSDRIKVISATEGTESRIGIRHLLKVTSCVRGVRVYTKISFKNTIHVEERETERERSRKLP